MRNLQFPGRSPVRAQQGMIATSHPLASQTGLTILRNGGNAMDAAIAAAAVLAVVEPQATGIGGDSFVLFSPAGSGQVKAYNGSGRAPAAASSSWYRDHGYTSLPERGPHSVTVPGAIDAWCQLATDHGTLPIGTLLQDAIAYAESGVAVTDRVAFDWARNVSWLSTHPEMTQWFLPKGRAPQAGEIYRNPALARTLANIAEKGRSGFYEGAVAQHIVATLRREGGLHTLDDFASAAGEYVEPIHTCYRGYDLYQVPPNNQGLTALMMLNALEGFDLQRLGAHSAARYHLEIEAARLAYCERDKRIADSNHVHVPVEHLLSTEYTAHLRSQIDPKRASTALAIPLAEHSDTVYLSVVDKDRNAVSFISSIYAEFGSGIIEPESGVLLQNRGKSFSLDPTHPNCIQARKRPMHTIMPGMLMKHGQVQASLGVMGGDYQPTGQVHVLTNIIDFDMDPQEAIDAPRLLYQNGKVRVEQGIPSEVRNALTVLGHQLSDVEVPLGGGQIIWIDWDEGTLTGGSDPRKDGCALGY